MRFSAYSLRAARVIVSEVRARKTTGREAGLTLRKEGGASMLRGSSPVAREMADCTSRAAESRVRLKSNCRVMVVLALVLDEDMLSTPAMLEKAFSSGVATEEAMMSGFAPGRAAVTWMVGYSTGGRSLTGSWK
jgi:hypothetical protein